MNALKAQSSLHCKSILALIIFPGYSTQNGIQMANWKKLQNI